MWRNSVGSARDVDLVRDQLDPVEGTHRRSHLRLSGDGTLPAHQAIISRDMAVVQAFVVVVSLVSLTTNLLLGSVLPRSDPRVRLRERVGSRSGPRHAGPSGGDGRCRLPRRWRRRTPAAPAVRPPAFARLRKPGSPSWSGWWVLALIALCGDPRPGVEPSRSAQVSVLDRLAAGLGGRRHDPTPARDRLDRRLSSAGCSTASATPWSSGSRRGARRIGGRPRRHHRWVLRRSTAFVFARLADIQQAISRS